MPGDNVERKVGGGMASWTGAGGEDEAGCCSGGDGGVKAACVGEPALRSCSCSSCSLAFNAAAEVEASPPPLLLLLLVLAHGFHLTMMI